MDPQYDKPGIVRRRAYARRDTDRRTRRHNYVAMDPDTTLADVIAWAEAYVAVPFTEVRIYFSTFSWEDDATPEEIAEFEAGEQARARRTEKWQREQLATLIARYGVPEGVAR